MNILIKKQLCRLICNENVNGRFVQTYILTWYDGDIIEEPSETWLGDKIEIPEDIFLGDINMLIKKEQARKIVTDCKN